MTFGSLFSGIGGFDFGFDQAGIKCEWQVEKDLTCQKVLSRHWTNVEKFQDVKDVGKNNLRPVDVICGGFPCQDLSIAGRRQGLAGERSGLWFEFARIVGELEPRFVVIENVPGLLSSNGGKDFAIILRGLVECGYGVSWRILDAQYFGVAQRRRRVFIVGSLGNGSSARILFESKGVSWNPPSRKKTGQEIAETFAFSAGNSGDSYGIGLSKELAPPLRAGASGTNQTPTIARSLMSHGNRINVEEETFIAATLNSGGNNGGFRCEPDEHLIVVHETGKGFWTEGLPGIRANAGGMPENIVFDERNIPSRGTGQTGVRRLTPRECERLQGFPDDFTAWDAEGKKISNSARYKMLGNAVAVNVAKFIGKRIVSVLNV